MSSRSPSRPVRACAPAGATFCPCNRTVAGGWRPFPRETTHKEQIEVQQTTPPSPILPVFCLFFTMLLLPANNLMAASVDARQWEITADKITRYEDPASVIAEGNVILEKKESVTSVKEDAEDARWKKSNPEVNHRASAFAER